MQLRRADTVLWSWLAAAALLVSALAVAQPLRGSELWAGVCSSRGDAQSQPVALHHLVGHCAVCSLHATPGLPPQAGQALAHVSLAFAAPRGGRSAPRATPAWRHSQPRGPPSHA